ncbi:MAG: hypothetical protein HY906_11855 [Deltaproteobacteria bacterium]|nr:hypothetical protein [Deltaproteobacteria bacterium]
MDGARRALLAEVRQAVAAEAQARAGLRAAREATDAVLLRARAAGVPVTMLALALPDVAGDRQRGAGRLRQRLHDIRRRAAGVSGAHAFRRAEPCPRATATSSSTQAGTLAPPRRETMAERLIKRVETVTEEYIDTEPQPEPEAEQPAPPPRRQQVEDPDLADERPARPQPARRR